MIFFHRSLLEESPLNCRRPCTTVSYLTSNFEFPYDNFPDLNVSSLFIGIETTNIEIHEEYLLFDAGNIFTAIGGSLGLFLGFSFLDAFNFIAKFVVQNLNAKKRISNKI